MVATNKISNGTSFKAINRTGSFPYYSLLFSLFLICVAPFTTPYLVFAAFAISLYRLFFLDLSYFFVDIACLVSFANLYRLPGGTSLFSVLLLVAVLAFLVRRGAKANTLFGFSLTLIVLLTFRMQGDFVNFIWIVGSILITYFLVTNMTSEIAHAMTFSYCISVVGSSFFALFFRNFSAYHEYTRGDTQAIWGENVVRFKGLFTDPNYYAVLLVLALALLMQLYFSKNIKTRAFSVLGIATIVFGLMTYGKTFFLIFVLLLAALIILLFAKRKYFFGFLSLVIIAVGAFLVASGKIEFFRVVLSRFSEADGLNEATTGRFDSWMAYLRSIFSNVGPMFFGHGLRAPLVNGIGTHNLYLEVTYYLGFVGLALFVAFAVLCYHHIFCCGVRQKSLLQTLLQNLPLFVFLIFYLALQGMFTSTLFVQFVLAVSGGLIVTNSPNERM